MNRQRKIKENLSGWAKTRPEFFSKQILDAGFELHSYRFSKKNGHAASRSFRFLFFTDTHLRGDPTTTHPGGLVWRGAELPGQNLREAIRRTSPDALVFGGDLIGGFCCFQTGMDMLASLDAPRKFAVYGNWEKRRSRISFAVWDGEFRKAGFEPLVNGSATCGAGRIFGFDDAKKGFPEYRPPESVRAFNCVVAHNPDTIPLAMTSAELSETDLILCGHTHGGQFRIPGFGAFTTSTYSGKRLEYGLYSHVSGAKMLVSSGIGATFLFRRINTPPEILSVELSF